MPCHKESVPLPQSSRKCWSGDVCSPRLTGHLLALKSLTSWSEQEHLKGNGIKGASLQQEEQAEDGTSSDTGANSGKSEAGPAHKRHQQNPDPTTVDHPRSERPALTKQYSHHKGNRQENQKDSQQEGGQPSLPIAHISPTLVSPFLATLLHFPRNYFKNPTRIWENVGGKER